MNSQPLRIGTRGSALALYQASLVRDRLLAAHPGLAAEIVAIRTTGDRVRDRPLAEIGGKGLFSKEIEAALTEHRIDLAVHSLKDMETVLPDGLEIGCVLPRGDPRDALAARGGAKLADLPQGARVGTGALRRRAQLLRLRPDLDIAPIRGNVDTRLAKLATGEYDALMIAYCGVERLGRADAVTEILPPSVILPAVGQGALAVECRTGDDRIRGLLAAIHDTGSAACVFAERAMLAALDGSCRTPIAGYATIDGGILSLDALLLSDDGTKEYRASGTGAADDPAALGSEIGNRLRRDAGPDFAR